MLPGCLDNDALRRTLRIDFRTRKDPGRMQPRHQLGAGLETLTDPPDPQPHAPGRPEQSWQRLGVVGFARLGPMGVPAGDRIAIGRLQRIAQQLDEPLLDIVGDDVFPPAGLVVHVLPVDADDIGQQAFGQTVLPHDLDRTLPTGGAEFDMALIGDGEQPVALHAGDGL